jgi:hypothetical protein
MNIERHTIDRIIDFCEYNNIPNIPGALQMYELYHNDMYDKFSNKHVADQEIWSSWSQVYTAYTDPKLKYELNKHKGAKYDKRD